MVMLDIQIVWGGETHSFSLENGEHIVGRASDSAVQIPVPRVSKQHAVLRVDGEGLWVHDLGSTNGTEVNGQRIGRDDVEVPTGTLVSFAGAMLRRAGSMSTAAHQLPFAESANTLMRYNPSEGYSDAARDRIVSLSSGLFELLASDESSEQVEKAACKFVAQSVRSDRVVMLTDQGEGTTIDASSQWTRNPEERNAPLQISRTIISQVMSKRDSVLMSNPLEDQKYAAQQSIMALNLRSAMAAPLFDNERVRGILYVDTRQASVQYSQADLEVLTATANAVAVKLRNIRFERELETAAHIQRAMLPDVIESPEGYELDAYQDMCRAVGGDLYQSFRRPNERVLLALGDVSGKGVPAALAMSAATVLVGLLAELGGDLEELVDHFHAQLFRSLAPEQFITMFLAELDEASGALHYINAGHEPPLVVHADGSIDSLESTGLPIAMIEDVVTIPADTVLRPGDLMFVFSDGIPEATVDGERFLGLDVVKSILVEHRGEPLPKIRERILARVSDFLAGEHNSDDVTLLLLRRNPV
jgi:hypothetical protein